MDNRYIDLSISQAVLKELARLQLKISNYAFESQIIWCRVALNKFEVWNKAEHHHSFYELHLCCSGTATFEVQKDSEITIKAGDFVIFSPSTRHKLLYYSDDFSKLVLGFTLDVKESDELKFITDSYSDIKNKAYMASDRMLSVPTDILEEIKMRRKGFKFTICELLSLLIIESARVIILYMKNNIHANLTADEIAAVANMSSKQLNRIMLENYNLSISAFFKREKISKAKEMLEKTDMSIRQIAEAVGFSDEFSFGKSFKRTEGNTPAGYRSAYFQK